MSLVDKKCVPCQGGVPALEESRVLEMIKELDSSWTLENGNTRLRREFKFGDYKTSWELVNIVSQIAEDEWHHPEIHFGYGHLEIEIWTHKIGGLVESDFIYASKVDKAFKEFQKN